ncbi:MAG: hypothetical protein KBT01_02020 [Clostridiales bacterium]|nr:hypothetical protein [Candidatus Blautia equi]
MKKEERQQEVRRTAIMIGAGVAIVIVILVLILLLFRKKPEKTSDAAVETQTETVEKTIQWGKVSAGVQEGLDYLDLLEAKDPGEAVKAISDLEKRRFRDKLMENPNSVWSAFDDSVIVGDSRVVGFWFWEFLPESRAVSEGGAMVADMPNFIDRIASMDPANVFLAFGLNDYGCGEWPDPEEYTKVFVDNVQIIKDRLPEAKIFVNSTFPAVGIGLSASPQYPYIGNYNTALKAMCEREGYVFIDNDQIAAENESLYDDDGLHFQKELYSIWAIHMLEEEMGL